MDYAILALGILIVVALLITVAAILLPVRKAPVARPGVLYDHRIHRWIGERD